jgi:hypothetical protein
VSTGADGFMSRSTLRATSLNFVDFSISARLPIVASSVA